MQILKSVVGSLYASRQSDWPKKLPKEMKQMTTLGGMNIAAQFLSIEAFFKEVMRMRANFNCGEIFLESDFPNKGA